MEFEYALEQRKPLFSVVITEKALDEKVTILGRSALEDKYPIKLEEFKALATSNIVEFWDDKKDIQLAIFKTLSDFIYRKELIGWIRGDNNINTALLAEEIAKLTSENSDLREKLSSTTKNNVLYCGLIFEQLKSLLEKSKFNLNGNPSDLFQFLIFYGSSLIDYSYHNPNDDITKYLDVLSRYKILVKSNSSIPPSYILTEDGHKFYIRAIFENSI